MARLPYDGLDLQVGEGWLQTCNVGVTREATVGEKGRRGRRQL